MKAAIVIDKWKLAIFTRHLKSAGFSYEDKGALEPNTIVLHVETASREALQPTIVAAQVECARAKRNAQS